MTTDEINNEEIVIFFLYLSDKISGICLVCGDKAWAIHDGVLSCDGCKDKIHDGVLSCDGCKDKIHDGVLSCDGCKDKIHDGVLSCDGCKVRFITVFCRVNDLRFMFSSNKPHPRPDMGGQKGQNLKNIQHIH